MDQRKQKRLGAAPIASFEKSFEDSGTAAAAVLGTGATRTAGTGVAGGVVTHSSTTQAVGKSRDVHTSGGKMDSRESNFGTASKSTGAAATTSSSTNNSREPLASSSQQPGHTFIVRAESQQPSTSASSTSMTTKLKRPPPLGATMAAGATSTLVSSGEQRVTFRGATTLTTPLTPRIELSRASSSSHHEEDSRESSPENVFEQVGTGTLQETIGLGFREEGALELRSSTEELYFMDPEQKKEEQEKIQQQQTKRSSPHIFKFDEHQTYLQQHQRKDSASSEVAALLCISGRTSRISSVGSQGSAVSRLSAISGVSRSPSPHRMLLETSFCGPKPLENVVDGRVLTTIEPPTVELLEQVLLSRKHDPTQAVLAEGIQIDTLPKKKPTTLSNGDSKMNAKIAKQNKPNQTTGALMKSKMGAQRGTTKSPGHMVVGKTSSGTEYIRINLKPDHMYEDKGIAPNERVVEAPNSLAPLYSRSQKKPVSLSLGRSAVIDENRLTPSASPKPSRPSALAKDTHGSRSPSPAAVSVSRKSSFSSLFRLGGKDSPESPRERTRSRSKSKDRQTPQSLNVTPSKQKSVLAIFKPGKRASDSKSSKSSSPIDGHEQQQLLLQQRTKPPPPPMTATGSRPNSRLRYYDEGVEGVIHIPLHTPPEEKETLKLLQGIQQLIAEPARPMPTAITASQLAAAAAALKPVGARKDSLKEPPTRVRVTAAEQAQRAEDPDAIHSIADCNQSDGQRAVNWSLEVNRHSSQDSQETVGSDASYASAIKVPTRSYLANVAESVSPENGIAAAAEIHRLPSRDSVAGVADAEVVETVAMINSKEPPPNAADNDAVAREKRRLLFATRLGSGSQEQIFSTQFSISKTESQSSQMSEQAQEKLSESPDSDFLRRQGTVIRRSEDDANGMGTPAAAKGPPLKRHTSKEATAIRPQSVSTSEDERPNVPTTATAVVLRSKETHDEHSRKSRPSSEEDAVAAVAATGGSLVNPRHSRYLEHFDVRKKYHENVPRKPKRESISGTSRSEETAEEPPSMEIHQGRQEQQQQEPQPQQQREPKLPQPSPPSTAPSPLPSPGDQSAAENRTPTATTPVPTRSQSQSPVERSRQTPTKPPRTTTPTRHKQSTPPSPSSPAADTVVVQLSHKRPKQSNRQSFHSTDEPVESSESERDSDLATVGGHSAAIDPKRRHLARHLGTIEDHESTGLVSQESFDDELPYIPTTLPEERAYGVALIPMKERVNMELKTCPVDRPRSTTPLNPSHLEEYCGIVTPVEPTYELSGSAPVRGEKLRISLPRKDPAKEKAQSAKSPRRPSNASGKSWFEFAEEGLRATPGSNLERKDSNRQLLAQQQHQLQQQLQHKQIEDAKPKVVRRATTTTAPAGSAHVVVSTQRKLSGHWIDFENIPEKRKPPKRITTLPKDGVSSTTTTMRNHQHSSAAAAAATGQQQHEPGHGHHHHHHHHHAQTQPDVTASTATTDDKLYDYVKPEDCQCECHEMERESSGGTAPPASDGTDPNGKPLTNVDLLPQGEDLLPLLDPELQDGIEPSDSSREYNIYTDDEMDVPVRQSSSSRSKSSSSKLDEFPRRDVSHSHKNKRFPDNRM